MRSQGSAYLPRSRHSCPCYNSPAASHQSSTLRSCTRSRAPRAGRPPPTQPPRSAPPPPPSAARRHPGRLRRPAARRRRSSRSWRWRGLCRWGRRRGSGRCAGARSGSRSGSGTRRRLRGRGRRGKWRRGRWLGSSCRGELICRMSKRLGLGRRETTRGARLGRARRGAEVSRVLSGDRQRRQLTPVGMTWQLCNLVDAHSCAMNDSV